MRWSIPNKMIMEARELVDQGRVLKVIPNEDKHIWRSEVIDDKKYEVILDGTGKEEDICHCPIWQQKSYCPHTTAVELFLKDHEVVRSMKYSKHPLFCYPDNIMDQHPSIQGLLENYRHRICRHESINNLAEVEQLKVIFELHEETVYPFQLTNERLFYLRIKLGFDHCYYVQDLSDFFQKFGEEEAYHLSSRHDQRVWLIKTAFEEKVYEVLKQLESAYHLSSQSITEGMNIPLSHQNSQRFYLDAVHLREILTLYPETETSQVVFMLDEQPVTPELKTKGRPVLLELQKEGDSFLVIMNPLMRLYKHYQLIYDGKEFYRVHASIQYFEDLQALQILFADHNYKWLMTEKETQEFISYFGYQILAHGLINNVVLLKFADGMGPLNLEAVIDVKQEKLLVTFIYHYGEYCLTQQAKKTHEPSDGIILRDLFSEEYATHFLEKLGFNRKGLQFSRRFSDFNETMLGLDHLLNLIPDEWQVTYSKALSHWQDKSSQFKMQVEPNPGHRLLKIAFTMDDVNDEQVNQILQAISKDQSYVQLDDGKIINLKNIITPQQNTMLKQLRQHMKSFKNGASLPAYQALKFADALGQTVDFEQFYEDIIHPNRSDYQTSPQLKAELADYQSYAVQWLNQLSKYNLGGLLADEMGLGKTVQAIGFLADYYDQLPETKVLILAPASVIYNWRSEFHRFAPTLPAIVIDGNAEEREKIRQEHPHSIWISSYYSYRNDCEAYQKDFFDILILDEAQALKNEQTILYQTMAEQSAGMRIGLSGTPLENNLSEFWALMQMILPGLLPSKRDFQNLPVATIRTLVSPFVLRRTKEEVALELPNKSVHNQLASLETDQKAIYLAYLKDIQERLNGDAGSKKNLHLEMLSAITRLRQICCHPALIKEDYQGKSGKFEYFKQLLENALDNKRRVLVFSQFTSMLSIIKKYLDEQGISSFIIEGKTKKKERQRQVTAFNNGEGSVFLISLRAGGVGINLTGADTVFLYDLWWNPSVEEQAIGRAHRIGQTKDVQVYRLITEGTIEERIAELQEEKRQLFDELFNEEEMGQASHLSIDDLRFILDLSNS